MFHYVYRIDEIETGEFYIGSRSCNIHPSLDGYLGSMSTWKPCKENLRKTIIKDDFPDRTSAIECERDLINAHIKDPLNRNYHIPGKGFHTIGLDRSGKNNSFYDKKHSDETRKKMKESALSRNINSENEELRRKKISESLTGQKKPKSFSDNMSKARRGENNPYAKFLKENNIEHANKGKKYEKTECPHCKKLVAITKAKQWHFDNCKEKQNI
jgi:hypothetical protein